MCDRNILGQTWKTMRILRRLLASEIYQNFFPVYFIQPNLSLTATNMFLTRVLTMMNRNGLTSLHYAVLGWQLEVVKVALQEGADPRISAGHLPPLILALLPATARLASHRYVHGKGM